MRPACMLAAAAAGLALAGCDAPGAAPGGAAAAFAAKCAALPASRFEVVAVPIRVAYDATRSQRELTLQNERPSPQHVTLGLTQAHVGHRAAVEVSGLQEAGLGGGTGAVCMRMDVRVELVMDPLTVYLAREIDADPCQRAAVRAHESKHVAVYESALAASPSLLAARLEMRFGGRVLRGPSAAAVQAQAQGELAHELDRFLAETGLALRERQAAVDTPEEYARVHAACRGPRPS